MGLVSQPNIYSLGSVSVLLTWLKSLDTGWQCHLKIVTGSKIWQSNFFHTGKDNLVYCIAKNYSQMALDHNKTEEPLSSSCQNKRENFKDSFLSSTWASTWEVYYRCLLGQSLEASRAWEKRIATLWHLGFQPFWCLSPLSSSSLANLSTKSSQRMASLVRVAE